MCFVYLESASRSRLMPNSDDFDPFTTDSFRNALGMLDGDNYSILVISEFRPSDSDPAMYSGRSLVIGGGNTGYIVEAFLTPGSDEVDRLVNPKHKGGATQWMKRGQLMEVPGRFIVDVAAVYAAVIYFVEELSIAADLVWEHAG